MKLRYLASIVGILLVLAIASVKGAFLLPQMQKYKTALNVLGSVPQASQRTKLVPQGVTVFCINLDRDQKRSFTETIEIFSPTRSSGIWKSTFSDFYQSIRG